MSDDRPPHFVPVCGPENLGCLAYSGREECSRAFPHVSGDGLWREQGRPDGGTLFLLIDVEGKGPVTIPLRETLELALDDDSTWDMNPGELLVELHSQAAVVWAETERSFVAQAVLVLPSDGHFLVASAGIPYPYHATPGQPWKIVEAPSPSISWLGRPDIHEEGGPTFPDRKVDLAAGDHYLACSDGIVEAGRPKTLGPNGLLEFLNGMADRPRPHELLDRVFGLAAKHDGATWPGDDSTAVAWHLEQE